MGDKHSLKIFLFFSFLPVLFLASLFPERLLLVSRNIENHYSVPGADIVAFIQEDCGHCRQFKRFALQQGWPVEYHELGNSEAQSLFDKLIQAIPGITWSTPTVIVNGFVFQGYHSDDETGSSIKNILDNCQKHGDSCLSFYDLLQGTEPQKTPVGEEQSFCPLDGGAVSCNVAVDDEYVFNVWLLGPVDLASLSLPVLTILLGFLDGFNPCAMWVLVSLLTLLFTLNDMRKMLIIGFTFLLVSGAMYYLFIAAWLNVFLFVGYNFWIQKIIGIIAVGAGGFYYYESFGKDPNACQVTNLEQRQKIIGKMKKVLQYSSWPLMLGGITVLAISVNMIELICTAGLPAVFSKILANNHVSSVARYAYLLLYVVIYMIDDLIIFAIALFTMQATGITTKYRRATFIFGGTMMYGLGILMMFFPEVLIFN